MRRRTVPSGPTRSAWCSALCSESIGSTAAAARGRGGHHQLTRGDERLLVGEGHLAPEGERTPCRDEAERTHEGGHDGRCCGVGRDGLAPLGPGEDLDVRGSPPQLRGVPLVADADHARPPGANLLGEKLERCARRRGPPPRTSPGSGPPRRGSRCRSSRSSRGSARRFNPVPRAPGRARGRTGRRRSSESLRSRNPPCPGSRSEESLTPASRLNSDSTRSPERREHGEQHSDSQREAVPAASSGKNTVRQNQTPNAVRRMPPTRPFPRLPRAHTGRAAGARQTRARGSRRRSRRPRSSGSGAGPP